MSKISYTGKIDLLAVGYASKNWEIVKKSIKDSKDGLTYYIEKDENIYGYEIRENIPLSRLYGFRIRVVDFEFSYINDVLSSEENEILNELFLKIKDTIEVEPAYYTFRVPTAIMGVLMMINKYFPLAFMCGGIISYITAEKTQYSNKCGNITGFFASEDYISEHKDELVQLSKKIFKMYRGQYHISPVTASKAMEIYSDWVINSFENNDKFFIVECEGNIAGYATLTEEENVCKAVLGGVSDDYRNMGIYNNIIRSCVDYTNEKNKLFIIGTQFENLIVQGTWTSMGLKPFTSFYNFHLDVRK